jgi:hypothetical protein
VGTSRRSSNPILQIAAPIAIVLLLAVSALSIGSSESSLGHDLQSHGVRTVGTVTAAEPSNHDYFSYSYTVNGSKYPGDSNSFISTVDASQLHVGEHIAVVYDAENPRESCSCDVNELSSSARSNDLLPLFIAIPVITVYLFALLIRNRRHQKVGG